MTCVLRVVLCISSRPTTVTRVTYGPAAVQVEFQCLLPTPLNRGNVDREGSGLITQEFWQIYPRYAFDGEISPKACHPPPPTTHTRARNTGKCQSRVCQNPIERTELVLQESHNGPATSILQDNGTEGCREAMYDLIPVIEAVALIELCGGGGSVTKRCATS